jgi:hypothetical protein
MVQDQLVDYISSQIKLGVSKDAIKSALVSAGWVAADVDDTLKKVDGGAGATSSMSTGMSTATTAKPASMSAMSSMMTSSPTTTAAKPATSTAGPQMVKVSDLVSASPASNMGSAGKPAGMGAGMASAKIDAASFGGKISGNSFQASPAAKNLVMGSANGGGKGAMIAWIVAAVFFLGFGGLAWYFYSGNASLATKVSMLTSQSATVNTQLTSLQSQVDASTTALEAQIMTLTAANADLALNLSFYAVPVGGATSTARLPQPVTINSGWLTVAKGVYWITTPRGTNIAVVNSSDPKIAPQLKPLVGDTVRVSGSYIPGSDQVTVDSVTNLSPVVATTTIMAATSTATSTH